MKIFASDVNILKSRISKIWCLIWPTRGWKFFEFFVRLRAVVGKYLEIFHLGVRFYSPFEYKPKNVADLLPFKIICGRYPKSSMGIER